MNLEQTLEALSRLGNPMLTKLQRGWWCEIDMFVPAVGTHVKVESETVSDPTQAATQCYERVLALNPNRNQTEPTNEKPEGRHLPLRTRFLSKKAS